MKYYKHKIGGLKILKATWELPSFLLVQPFMFLSLYISQLLITSTTISYLSSQFVIAELFCGTGLQQYSTGYNYERTYVEHVIPKNVDKCLIRLKDKLGNLYTRQIEIK